MAFAFLGWQPALSPDLFPMGYFLITSLPLPDIFSTYGTHISLKTEMYTYTYGGEANIHSTYLSRVWKFKE